MRKITLFAIFIFNAVIFNIVTVKAATEFSYSTTTATSTETNIINYEPQDNFVPDDNFLPIILFVEPQEEAIISNKILLKAQVSQDISELEFQYFTNTASTTAADYNSVGFALFNPISGLWEYIWDTTKIPDGSYYLTARASRWGAKYPADSSVKIKIKNYPNDNKGNSNAENVKNNAIATTTQQNIEQEPIEIDIISPLYASMVNGQMNFKIETTKPIKRLELIDAARPQSGILFQSPETDQPQTNFSILADTKTLLDGDHYLKARAIDENGQEYYSGAVLITIVNNALADTFPRTDVDKVSAASSTQIENIDVNIFSPNDKDEISGNVIFQINTSAPVEDISITDMKEKYSFALGKAYPKNAGKTKWQMESNSHIVSDGVYYVKARALKNGFFYDSQIITLTVKNGIILNGNAAKFYNPEIYGNKTNIPLNNQKANNNFFDKIKLFLGYNEPEQYTEKAINYTPENKKELQDLGGKSIILQSLSPTLKPLLPIFSNSSTAALFLTAKNLVAEDTKVGEDLIAPTLIAIDSDQDGLPDDTEIRLGTNPYKADSDNDSYLDGEEVNKNYNPLGAGALKNKTALSSLDKAIIAKKDIEQPILTGTVSPQNLQIYTLENVIANNTKTVKIAGRAAPNTDITLYVYSLTPLLLTTKTDTNGNWTYLLDVNLRDGQHKIYAATNNEDGQVLEKSNPFNFFISNGQAVSQEEFMQAQKINTPKQPQKFVKHIYWALGLIVMIILITVTITINKKPRLPI